MSKHQKTWSSDEKEKIVFHSIQHGVSKTSREFGFSAVSIYSWKEKFERLGKNGLQSGAMTDFKGLNINSGNSSASNS